MIQEDKECFVCHTEQNLHRHHIFYGTSNRKNSEKYGLCVWLCSTHHNLSKYGVHFDHTLDISIKVSGQRYFEANIGTRDEFRQIFGKSYI